MFLSAFIRRRVSAPAGLFAGSHKDTRPVSNVEERELVDPVYDELELSVFDLPDEIKVPIMELAADFSALGDKAEIADSPDYAHLYVEYSREIQDLIPLLDDLDKEFSKSDTLSDESVAEVREAFGRCHLQMVDEIRDLDSATSSVSSIRRKKTK